MKRYLLVVLAALVVACDNGGSLTVPDQTPDQLIGGVWAGTRYVMVADEDGRLIWFDSLVMTLGSGVATVDDKEVTAGFTLYSRDIPVPLPPDHDGRIAECIGVGTVQEREALTISVHCTRDDGTDYLVRNDIELDYLDVYEQGSSLETLKGLYQVDTDILEIGFDGSVLMQQAATSCTTSGDIRIIDPSFNLYEMSLSIVGCRGQAAVQNGTLIEGYAVLDNEFNPGDDTLVLLAICDRGGINFGTYIEATRI